MTGADLIAAERQRQVDVEGWTPEHDDEHDDGEMVEAAIAYAREGRQVSRGSPPNSRATRDGTRWPWDRSWWKPSADPVRNLVKAGALIAAEIDRLTRAGAS